LSSSFHISQSPPERRREGTTKASDILNLETKSEELTLEDLISEIRDTCGFAAPKMKHFSTAKVLAHTLAVPS
jgi:hypothetical protein